MNCPGTLFIISAPSGGGKTTLVRELISRVLNIQVSVSHTTRSPRPTEIDGQHYHFIDDASFEELKKKNKFLESAKVFQHWYGTSKDWVQEKLNSGIDVVLDIDWQGARSIKEQIDCKGIFIMPPSKEALRARLTGRSTDAKATIEHRMNRASEEMSHFDEYDYVIINDELEQAVSELEAIVCAERLSCQAQKARYAKLFSTLLGN
jgi:guanylate kinase